MGSIHLDCDRLGLTDSQCYRVMVDLQIDFDLLVFVPFVSRRDMRELTSKLLDLGILATTRKWSSNCRKKESVTTQV